MLLHICCAPCALPIIEYLLKTKKANEFALYFYNPNIFPKKEYEKRREEVEKIAKIYNLKLFTGDYRHEEWREYLEEELPQPPFSYLENKERCFACFRFRLEKTAQFARENKYERFGTTLSINRYKDTEAINNYGFFLAEKNHLSYQEFEIEPGKAHQLELELSRRYDLYRQKYCGCEFSLPKNRPL